MVSEKNWGSLLFVPNAEGDAGGNVLLICEQSEVSLPYPP